MIDVLGKTLFIPRLDIRGREISFPLTKKERLEKELEVRKNLVFVSKVEVGLLKNV